MAETNKLNTWPSVLSYEDVRAVSPARWSTTRKERSLTICGSVRKCPHATGAL